MKKSKEKNKKSLIILGVAAALLLFALGLTYFISYNNDFTVRIEGKKQKIKNCSSIIEKKGGKQARLEFLQNNIGSFNQKLLSGGTTAVAAAELQTILNDMASEFALTIQSQRILSTKERGNLLEVPVQITTQCSITNLKELLYMIEAYEKFFSISKLDLRSIRGRERKDVKASIDVSGFILNPDKML